MKTASAPEMILLLALLLCLPGSAAMALPPAPPGMEQAETRVVLIEEKAPGAHIIYVNERPFRVLPEAPILDRNGEPARLEGLPVPCKARITVTLYGDNRHPCVTNIVCLD